jgi:hypothetical protein
MAPRVNARTGRGSELCKPNEGKKKMAVFVQNDVEPIGSHPLAVDGLLSAGRMRAQQPSAGSGVRHSTAGNAAMIRGTCRSPNSMAHLNASTMLARRSFTMPLLFSSGEKTQLKNSILRSSKKSRRSSTRSSITRLLAVVPATCLILKKGSKSSIQRGQRTKA